MNGEADLSYVSDAIKETAKYIKSFLFNLKEEERKRDTDTAPNSLVGVDALFLEGNENFIDKKTWGRKKTSLSYCGILAE